MFVTTKVLLQQTYFCHDKHVFVMTKKLYLWQFPPMIAARVCIVREAKKNPKLFVKGLLKKQLFFSFFSIAFLLLLVVVFYAIQTSNMEKQHNKEYIIIIIINQ